MVVRVYIDSVDVVRLIKCVYASALGDVYIEFESSPDGRLAFVICLLTLCNCIELLLLLSLLLHLHFKFVVL